MSDEGLNIDKHICHKQATTKIRVSREHGVDAFPLFRLWQGNEVSKGLFANVKYRSLATAEHYHNHSVDESLD